MIITSIEAITPSPSLLTDAELIEEMCAERGEALEGLFRRYFRLVCRIAHRILRDRAEAEDITQEVFFEVYRKAHLYDPERGSVRGWLVQYAYHRTLGRKAALGRRAAYRGEPIEAVDARPQHGRQRLTLDECRWVLRTALARLPERQRTTLELTCFEDLPLRDVATRLGVSVGCTRHYYYRGLANLQQWARVTDHRLDSGCRTASPVDTTDGARGPERRLCARN
ncbi:MAG: sigma-70 family RNA polymerase sigma factor [Acidobacteria bacterium]|nr:sigma-70 family RNA polymerase sigma factor [Acidobacteriota bacterium]